MVVTEGILTSFKLICLYNVCIVVYVGKSIIGVRYGTGNAAVRSDAFWTESMVIYVGVVEGVVDVRWNKTYESDYRCNINMCCISWWLSRLQLWI